MVTSTSTRDSRASTSAAKRRTSPSEPKSTVATTTTAPRSRSLPVASRVVGSSDPPTTTIVLPVTFDTRAGGWAVSGGDGAGCDASTRARAIATAATNVTRVPTAANAPHAAPIAITATTSWTPITARRTGSVSASKRRWNAKSCAVVRSGAVRSTARPRARPNVIPTRKAASGLALNAPRATVRNTAAVMMYVVSPVPICQPNPLPYTHAR